MTSREIFWNIQFGETVYLLGFSVAAIVGYALWRRARLWRLGSQDDGLGTQGSRIRAFVRTAADGLWHRRIVRDRYVGVMHALIFDGFGLLFMGPLLDFVSEHFFHFMEGGVYLGVSLFLEVGGLLVLAGIGMAVYRRYVIRPPRLHNLWVECLVISFSPVGAELRLRAA